MVIPIVNLSKKYQEHCLLKNYRPLLNFQETPVPLLLYND